MMGEYKLADSITPAEAYSQYVASDAVFLDGRMSCPKKLPRKSKKAIAQAKQGKRLADGLSRRFWSVRWIFVPWSTRERVARLLRVPVADVDHAIEGLAAIDAEARRMRGTFPLTTDGQRH